MMQLSMAHGLTGNVGYLRAKVRRLRHIHCKISDVKVMSHYQCPVN